VEEIQHTLDKAKSRLLVGGASESR
jgi:hypothetical protein